MSEKNEYTPDLYTLEDDDGNEVTFELLDQMELNGITYYAMVSTDIINDDGELVVLKEDITSDEDGMLITIDDEEELDYVGNIFLERIKSMDEEEYED